MRAPVCRWRCSRWHDRHGHWTLFSFQCRKREKCQYRQCTASSSSTNAQSSCTASLTLALGPKDPGRVAKMDARPYVHWWNVILVGRAPVGPSRAVGVDCSGCRNTNCAGSEAPRVRLEAPLPALVARPRGAVVREYLQGVTGTHG